MILRLFFILSAFFTVFGCAASHIPDRSGEPRYNADMAEVVAHLPKPPGNIAVSQDHRVFFSFHPEADPDIKVAELVEGKPVAFPDNDFQQKHSDQPFFNTVLSLRVDSQNRLWTLDHGNFGRGRPMLLAFDIQSGELLHRYEFPSDIAGFGSFLNDFQITKSGDVIFIADTGAPLPIVGGSPAIIVYDVINKTARRVLEGHASVKASPHVVRVGGENLSILGFPIRIALDSIALDREGKWLYYGALNGENLYRIVAEHLLNPAMSEEERGAKVETYAPKTMSDGITTDLAGNIYLTDMEHSAVHIIPPDRALQTLLKDQRFRWPDGFSFGPDGWLYFTCSDLMNVIGKSRNHIASHAPYPIFRFKPGHEGIPGQ